MDTLEQNLRARLGLLTGPQAAKLLGGRFGTALEAGTEVTALGAGGFTEALGFQTEEAKELVAAMISVNRAGLDVAQIMLPAIRAAVTIPDPERGNLLNVETWRGIESVFRRAGVATPFSDVGSDLQQLLLTAEGSDRAVSKVHEMLSLLQRFTTVDTSVIPGLWDALGGGSGNIADLDLAMRLLSNVGAEQVMDTLAGVTDELNANQLAVAANLISQGDYLGLLQRIARWQERVAETGRESREGTPGTGAIADNLRASWSPIMEWTERAQRTWGQFLTGPQVEIDRSVLTVMDQVLDRGIKLSDLSKKERLKLEVAIEEGDTVTAIETLLRLLAKYEGRHEARLNADDRDARSKMDQAFAGAERWDRTTVAARLDADTSQAEQAISRLESQLLAMSQRSWNVSLLVTYGTGPYSPGGSNPGGGNPGGGDDGGGGDEGPIGGGPEERGLTFYRPSRARGRSTGIMTRPARGRVGATAVQGGDLHVHVAGQMNYEPADLARNMDGWLYRRGRR
jgi:hypothetical protein